MQCWKHWGWKQEALIFMGVIRQFTVVKNISTNIPTLESGYSYLNCIGELNGSHSVVLEPSPSVSCGNLLEMKIWALPGLQYLKL